MVHEVEESADAGAAGFSQTNGLKGQISTESGPVSENSSDQESQDSNTGHSHSGHSQKSDCHPEPSQAGEDWSWSMTGFTMGNNNDGQKTHLTRQTKEKPD